MRCFCMASLFASTNYEGNDPTESTERVTYNPILTNIFNQGHVAPIFSLAIERPLDSSAIAAGGFLAIGGLPPVRFGNPFANTTIQLYTITIDDEPTAPQYQFYSINITGVTYRKGNKPEWGRPYKPNPFAPPTTRPTSKS